MGSRSLFRRQRKYLWKKTRTITAKTRKPIRQANQYSRWVLINGFYHHSKSYGREKRFFVASLRSPNKDFSFRSNLFIGPESLRCEKNLHWPWNAMIFHKILQLSSLCSLLFKSNIPRPLSIFYRFIFDPPLQVFFDQSFRETCSPSIYLVMWNESCYVSHGCSRCNRIARLQAVGSFFFPWLIRVIFLWPHFKSKLWKVSRKICFSFFRHDTPSWTP